MPEPETTLTDEEKRARGRALRQAQTTETERRKHVEAAIADSRIEGYPPPSRPEQDILDAYIRGDIEANDLITAYLKADAFVARN